MISPDPVNPIEFVALVQPLLARKDLTGLLALLKSRWTADQITGLLSCDHCDARKVAALSLALVGQRCCLPQLSQRLKDPDPMTNEMAEHALWSIWFRCGAPEANEQLARGARALGERDFTRAIEHFTRAIEIDPTFAEAYNQRAIVHYLKEEFVESIADCREALERMPCHFGAWAGMGHCYAHLGNLREAVRCYEKAIRVNPHLAGMTETLTELRKQLGDSGNSSQAF